MFSLLLAFLFYSLGESSVPLGSWSPGRSTNYQGIDAGACSYGTIPTSTFPFGNIAAPNQAFWNNAATCGECYEVSCNSTASTCAGCKSGSVVIQVTDYCPSASNSQWCSGDMVHFDLSQSAFSAIADLNCGVIYTQYRRTTCDFTNNIQIITKGGSSAYWLSLFFLDVAGPGDLTAVSLKDSSSTGWVAGALQTYNGWLWTSNGLVTPLSFHLTNEFNQTLVLTNVITTITPGATTTTTQQFTTPPGYGGTTPASSPVTTTKSSSPTVSLSSSPVTTTKSSSSPVTYTKSSSSPVTTTKSSSSPVTTTPSSSPVTTTKSSSSSTSAGPADVVYTDSALTPTWSSWSYAATLVYTYTPGYTGSAIQVKTSGSYGAAYFHSSVTFTPAQYSTLSFYINPLTLNSNVLKVGIILSTSTTSPLAAKQLPTYPTNAWTQVAFTFASLGLSSTQQIDGFWVQGDANADTFLLDNLVVSP